MRSEVAIASSAILLASFIGATDAFWRLPCRGRAGLGRYDPIVDPGRPSSHVHTIQGPNKFGLSARPEDLRSSDCTSCGVKQDKSGYWTPPLYFIHQNGSAQMLEQPGGMLSYYLMYSNPGEKIHEFPQGFQMIAGDQLRRNSTCRQPEPPKSEWSGQEVSQDALSQKALGFNCLNYHRASLPQSDPYYKQDEPSLYRHFLPNKTFIDNECPDGLRVELFFPSCWNGKDADAHDHSSHMAYPKLIQGGDCPPGYPVRVPSLFYETIWSTAQFKDAEGEFAFANGDPTGFGYHGDFMAGWKEGFLQSAIDDETCGSQFGSGTVESCKLFDLADDKTMQHCKFPEAPALKSKNDESTQEGEGLPGNNPLQYGPQPAKKKGGSKQKGNAQDLSLASKQMPSGSSSKPLPKPMDTQPEPVSSAGNQPGFANPAMGPPKAAYEDISSSSAREANANERIVTSTAVAPPPPPEESSSIIWSTDGKDVWKIYVDEVTRTKTMDSIPTGYKARRHLHQHAHHHHHWS